MLLIILCMHLIKASIESNKKNYVYEILSEENDNNYEEITVDPSYVPLGGTIDPLLTDDSLNCLSDTELLDDVSTKQQHLPEDNKDEKVEDIENCHLPEIKNKRLTAIIFSDKSYQRVYKEPTPSFIRNTNTFIKKSKEQDTIEK